MAAPDSCTISFTDLVLTVRGVDVIADQLDRLWNTWRAAPDVILCSLGTVVYLASMLASTYGRPVRPWTAPTTPGPVGSMVNLHSPRLVTLVWDPEAADRTFTFLMAPDDALVPA